MRIGLDAKRLFFNRTGLGNFSRTLVRHLVEAYPQADFVLCSPRSPRLEDIPAFVQEAGLPIVFPKRWSPLWRFSGMVKALQTHQIEVYHGLSHEIPMGLREAGISSVVTMHDLIWKAHPEYYPWIDRQLYQWKYQRSAVEASHVVAISAHTQSDVVHYFGVPEEKVSVIYQGIHPRFREAISPAALAAFRKEKNLPKSFLLYVGSLNARKQALLLIDALSKIPVDKRLPLVIAGTGKAYQQQVIKRISDLKLEKWVRHIGYVEDDILPLLYASARMTVYPSAYEGFGLPIVESLAMGTPVITTRFSALPEAGGPGALYLDALNADQLARHILELSQNEALYTQLQANGRKHVLKFDNKAAAAAYYSIYETVSW